MKGLAVLFFICALFHNPIHTTGEDEWNGNWFPHPPQSSSNTNENINDLHDPKHGIVMGVKNRQCDDGKTMLEVDYDGSSVNYTCYEDRRYFRPNPHVHPILENDHIPKKFSATHYCMHHQLTYEERIPTFGPHRPLWAKYGEYNFVPKQRWLHNLEHGAIVMLYHPCADLNEVADMKRLIKSCLFRHIITPYGELTPERPLALVSWGSKLTMSKFNEKHVVDFILEHMNNAPEKTSKDGQYTLGLIHPAKIVSDKKDQHLCPNYENKSKK